MEKLSEDHNIEYKEDIPKKANQLKAEIVSFLNSSTGGTIYLGVDDDGVSVTYSTEGDRNKKYKFWEETISNWVANGFRPEITGLIQVDPNSDPFKISVSAGTNKPYYYTDGEGFNSKGVYIRNGSSKRRASDAEIKRMLNRHNANSFDSEKIKLPSLDFSYVENVFEKDGTKFDIIGLDFKKNEEDQYNNAAWIVSDENPFVSKAAIYDGVDVATFRDKKIFSGSVAKQIDDAIQYIHFNNQLNITFGHNGKRIENFSYPMNAVREAVINAFVHRDYTMSSDIKIELFDDRLAISSPGSLPDGLTLEDIKQGANAKRNPILINVLDKMNYIENYGSGIRRIYSLYEGFKRQPELIATHNLFKVILYNMNYKLNSLDLSDNMISIIQYLNDGKLASRQEIQEALNLQKSYTLEMISELKKMDIIGSEGRGPSTRYYLEVMEKQ
ncbi:transcriptional regulator [Enterococcus durans]|uniref:ATP-binding protein n=1 Tax=Enterococcus durans TaxID=53345 RepID=UPI001883E40D|nr:ATP-binding protein [Enterococcus durans]MBE9888095.1 transcriptional regulator [Enterococcus durans]